MSRLCKCTAQFDISIHILNGKSQVLCWCNDWGGVLGGKEVYFVW